MVAAVFSASALPGPPPVPLLGVMGNFLRLLRDPAGQMIRLHRAYGEVAALARGNAKYVFAFGPHNNQRVLGDPALFQALDAKTMPLPIPPGSALARLYAGLHQMNGARHEQQRRLLLPALQRSRVLAWCEATASLVERRLLGWRVGQPFDLLHALRELALAIAVQSRLGLEPDREGKAVFLLLQRWLSLVFSPFALLLPVNLPLLPYRCLLRVSDQLEAEIRTLVGRKKACQADAGDMLAALVRVREADGNGLTDDELVGQVAALFVAGHDITARALTWTLFLLAQHPRTLAQVLDEVDGLLKGGRPSPGQLDQLPLLENVLKESMRLLPPVLWWARVTAAPCELGRYALPARSVVMISHLVTHRLPGLYDRPTRFLPERWARARPGPYEYLPFSAGPRLCPGMTAAMMEMKIVLALLLQHYRLALPRGVRVDCAGPMLSAPRGGLPVAAHRQDRRFRKEVVRGTVRDLVDLT